MLPFRVVRGHAPPRKCRPSESDSGAFLDHYIQLHTENKFLNETCSTGLAIFANLKQVRGDPHTTVLLQGWNNPAPSERYAAIHEL